MTDQSEQSVETSFPEELTLVTRLTILRVGWAARVKSISIPFTKELSSSNPRGFNYFVFTRYPSYPECKVNSKWWQL